MKRLQFADCLKENKLFETGVPDKSMARELLRLAEHRLAFWESVKGKAPEFPKPLGA